MWHVEANPDYAESEAGPLNLIWHSHPKPSGINLTQDSIRLGCGDAISLNGMATVVVGDGDEKQSFRLPQNILSSKSTFFNSYFEAGISANPESKIILPGDSPQTFGQLFEWMCDSPDEDELIYGDDEEVIRYMEVYVMAEKYHVEDVQNALADGLGFCWVSGISPDQ